MLEIQERNGATIFLVRVQPRASRDEISGEMDGALRVRLRAPAVEDRANQALVEFLAQLLKASRATCVAPSSMAGCFMIFAAAIPSRKAS